MSVLCLACGLCCDGTIFDFVPLTQKERHVITKLGLPILERTAGPAICQPCEALDGTACQIYTARPHPCRAFRCGLLEAVGQGKTSMREALSVVHQAHVHLRTLAEALAQTPDSEPMRPRLTNEALVEGEEPFQSGPVQGARRILRRRYHAPLDQALRALEQHLDQSFRKVRS